MRDAFILDENIDHTTIHEPIEYMHVVEYEARAGDFRQLERRRRR
jgi:hypothetical protein